MDKHDHCHHCKTTLFKMENGVRKAVDERVYFNKHIQELMAAGKVRFGLENVLRDESIRGGHIGLSIGIEIKE